MFLALVFALIAGLAIGSFLNVVIYRVPRGESVVSPRSRCPKCGHEITAIENVPIFSWLFLRGKCRECGNPISPIYPLVELLTGLLFVGVVAVSWDDENAAFGIASGLILVTALVPITFSDLEFKIVPNKITLPAAIALLIAGTALDPSGEAERIIAAVAITAPFVILALLLPGKMGMGDPKLMGVLGLALGRAVVPAIFIAFIAGTAVGIFLLIRHGQKARRMKVPFGPFLALGGAIAFVVGESLMDSYLDTFNN